MLPLLLCPCDAIALEKILCKQCAAVEQEFFQTALVCPRRRRLSLCRPLDCGARAECCAELQRGAGACRQQQLCGSRRCGGTGSGERRRSV